VSQGLPPRFGDCSRGKCEEGEGNAQLKLTSGARDVQNLSSAAAAVVPCDEFSQAKNVGNRNMESTDRLVVRTLKIIDYFKPIIWWKKPLIWNFERSIFMKGIPSLYVEYCKFSDGRYKKPT
jgi:hypothetical protein